MVGDAWGLGRLACGTWGIGRRLVLLLGTGGSLVAHLVAAKAGDCCRSDSVVRPWRLTIVVVSLEVVARLAVIRLEVVLVRKW